MPKKCGNFASTTKLASSGLSLPVLLGCSAFRMRSSVRKASSIEIRQTGHTAAFFKGEIRFISSRLVLLFKKHTIVEVRCGGSIRGKGLAALPLCWFQALFTSNYCGKNGRLS